MKSEPALAIASATNRTWSRFPVWLVAGLLVLVTIALYWPAMQCAFLNYDDGGYVTSNNHVQAGLTLESIKWAFLSPVEANWHPLTVLSHMLDCQLFGLNPRGHHLTSVLFHALNAVLVFALLQQLTGATWRSLLAAALFAVHPLHVESVAWVAERKDVLSACFGLLALLFYARYAQRRSRGADHGSPAVSSMLDVQSSSAINYSLSLAFFICGLMSKAMLVTWPFVMLLLDYWPLQRVTSGGWRVSRQGNWKWLLWEKLPFFALSAAASVMTFVAQQHGGAFAAGENLPLSARGANALISCCCYLGKTFWPTDLAVFYPHPGYWPVAKVLLAGGLLAGISALLIVMRRRHPFLLMGWLWFCGTLVPVIGLVQVGGQAMADRYTYIPSLGVLILVVWGAHELTRRWRLHMVALLVAGSAAIGLCLALTRQQIGYWQDGETLFRHALEVTDNNHIAHLNLGIALGTKGQVDRAISEYQEAIRLKPDFAKAHYNLGAALGMKGQIDQAISQYKEVIRLTPDDAEAHYNLGLAFGRKGQIDEAISQYRETIRLKPDDADVHNNLGNALFNKGQIDEAVRQYQEAIRLKPDYVEAHNNLGVALGNKDQIDEAIGQFQEAIRLKPDNAEAYNNLGYLWAERGENLEQARAMIEKAVKLEPKNAVFLDSLGWVLFKLNRPREALDYLLRASENSSRPDAGHYDHLGDVYAALNQRDRAAEAWRKSLSVEPNPQIQKKLADLSGH